MSDMELRKKRAVIASALWIVLFYVAVGSFASRMLYEEKMDARRHHLDRIDSKSQEEGRTWIDPKLLVEDSEYPASRVTVGIYVDHIVDLSTKNTNWTVDFYLWFRWHDRDLNPGDTYQVVDGKILTRKLLTTWRQADENYALYRVVARITKFFNVSRYPRDDHLLTLAIEDSWHSWQRLHYVPDIDVSKISSRVKLPGYRINKTMMVTKPHPYKSNRGDPRLADDHMAVYDQVIFGIEICRPDWGLYFKMFQALFASVAVALLAFFMNPSIEQRVGLGIGAFFASVASSYVTTTQLPGVGILTFSDIVNILGMTTIFLSVLCSIVAMHFAEGRKHLEIVGLFDRVSLVVMAVGYIGTNIVIARIASL